MSALIHHKVYLLASLMAANHGRNMNVANISLHHRNSPLYTFKCGPFKHFVDVASPNCCAIDTASTQGSSVTYWNHKGELIQESEVPAGCDPSFIDNNKILWCLTQKTRYEAVSSLGAFPFDRDLVPTFWRYPYKFTFTRDWMIVERGAKLETFPFHSDFGSLAALDINPLNDSIYNIFSKDSRAFIRRIGSGPNDPSLRPTRLSWSNGTPVHWNSPDEDFLIDRTGCGYFWFIEPKKNVDSNLISARASGKVQTDRVAGVARVNLKSGRCVMICACYSETGG